MEQFQQDPEIRAAVLSITACALGLNLTAASVAVFVELYWVPGVIFQVNQDMMPSFNENIEILDC